MQKENNIFFNTIVELLQRKQAIKFKTNLLKHDRKLTRKFKDIENALGLTMNHVCDVSDNTATLKSHDYVDKVIQQAEISSLIPCSSNAEIEAIADNPEKKEAIAKYIFKVTPKTNKYYASVHRALLKEPMINRCYLSDIE